MGIGTYISIITLNVNGLNAPTKRHRLAEGIQKQDSIYMGLVSIPPVCVFWWEPLIHLHLRLIIDMYVPITIFLNVLGLLL